MMKALLSCGMAFLLIAATSRDALESDFKSVGVLLQYEAEGVRVANEVAPRGVFLSLPVSHRHTGVLTRDVHYLKKGVPGAVFLKAGASGFRFAGGSSNDPGVRRTWCFTETPQVPSPKIKCIADMSGGNGQSWAEALAPWGRFKPVFFSKGFGAGVQPPQIDVGPAKVHPDLRMECLFLKWGKTYADIRCLLGGDSLGLPGTFLRIDRGSDGLVDLETPAGRLRLTPKLAGATVVRVN